MIRLENRGVLSLRGDDVVSFLDNILTNNIDNATNDNAVFAGLLTPQGKYMFDMFVIKTSGENGDEYLLDANNITELAKRLRMYKLRSRVEIIDLSEEFGVFANINNDVINAPSDALIIYKDPRNEQMGYRIIAPINSITDGGFNDYEHHRINLGIPELQQDLIREGDFALEGLMDEMGAIDFHKGCYVGQEMTSRMKRRTTVKNKLTPISFNGNTPEHNSPIYADDNLIGYIRSSADNIGIALIRTDKLESALLEKKKIIAQDSELFIRK